MLIKSDNTIHHYRRVSSATSLDTLLTDGASPAQVVMVREANNREAIAFDPADGTTFYTVSEKTGPSDSLVAHPVFKYQLATGDDSVEGAAETTRCAAATASITSPAAPTTIRFMETPIGTP